MISATEALERLREGNRRFVAGDLAAGASVTPARRTELTGGQEPFAVVVGCADSRVPVEHVFDQGLGELFVIRVAGNVAAPPVVGSVEFAAAVLGTRLVVVLGHTGCGAVGATLDELERPGGVRSPGLRSIVGAIRPAIEELAVRGGRDEALARRAVRANARAAAEQLRRSPEVLAPLVESGELRVVVAEYDLEAGAVRFFDGVPE